MLKLNGSLCNVYQSWTSLLLCEFLDTVQPYLLLLCLCSANTLAGKWSNQPLLGKQSNEVHLGRYDTTAQKRFVERSSQDDSDVRTAVGWCLIWKNKKHRWNELYIGIPETLDSTEPCQWLWCTWNSLNTLRTPHDAKGGQNMCLSALCLTFHPSIK